MGHGPHGKNQWMKLFPKPKSALMKMGDRPVFTPVDLKEQARGITLRCYSTLTLGVITPEAVI